MKKLLLTLLLLALPNVVAAQITPPYVFTAGTTILSSQVNANFAMFADALNRTGGTVTGNIIVDDGITIDGVDISTLSTGSPAVFTASTRGTVGAPAFSFVSDPDTGMWSASANRLDWALGGVNYLTLTSSGLTVAGGLNITGDFTIGATKFTVATATGNTNIAGTLDVTGMITGNLTGDVTGNLTDNADTVTNGVYTTGSYADPSWITSLDGSKITGIAPGGKIVGSVTEDSVSTSGAGEDTLATVTVPAGTLASDGDALRIVAFGTITNVAGNNKTIKLKFGSSTVCQIGPDTFASQTWFCDAIVSRKDATNQLAVSHRGLSTVLAYNISGLTTPTETLANAVNITVTGQVAVDTDIITFSSLSVQGIK